MFCCASLVSVWLGRSLMRWVVFSRSCFPTLVVAVVAAVAAAVAVRYDQRAEALGKKGMIQTDNM